MVDAIVAGARTLLTAALVVVMVVVAAIEGVVFAFALYAEVIGLDGHFRRGFLGFLVHLTLLLVCVTGLRAVARGSRNTRAT